MSTIDRLPQYLNVRGSVRWATTMEKFKGSIYGGLTRRRKDAKKGLKPGLQV